MPKLAVGEGQNLRSFEQLGPLASHLRFAERAARKLARSTFYAMTRRQAELEHRQAGGRRADRRHRTALWRNDDDVGYEAAQTLLDGRYTWLEEGVL